jgi:chitin disaccharide deacetylase
VTVSTAPTTDRALIVNADDFGLTAGVNAGIIGAHRRGLVRAASLLVTTPGFADAVALARTHPALDLGLHLALTGVRPVLSPPTIGSLVTRAGNFPTLGRWLARTAARRLRAEQVRAELRAQIERGLATGLRFTHLDGHHHVHFFPPVAGIVASLAREYRVPIVRRVRYAPGDDAPPKHLLLASADARWGAVYNGFARANAFRGFAFPASLENWATLCAGLPPGVTELMCHPGLDDPAVQALDPYVALRALELRWLTDERVAALFASAGIAITTFAATLLPAAERAPC